MTAKPAQPKRKTRAALAAELGVLRDQATGLRGERDQAERAYKESCEQIDDLKERLAYAESENQRMRGYIERVQEDDTVREELVKTGDPQGEERLVPKRRSTIFAPQFTAVPPDGRRTADFSFERGAINTRRRHWVTYGVGP